MQLAIGATRVKILEGGATAPYKTINLK